MTMNEQFVPALIDGEINSEILDRPRYESGGLRFCNRNGAGSVPDVENIGYMGAMVLMKPSLFLTLAAPLEGYTKTVDYLMSGQETVFGTPFLDINLVEETRTAQVKGHEGRSRMTFFKGLTDDAPMPVALFIRESNYTLRARQIEPWMLELIQSGVTSERTPTSRGNFVDGPLFEQSVYIDKAKKVARVSVLAPCPVPSF
jgi:hypothetical protein